MTMLPDIDEGTWQDYNSEEFKRRAQESRDKWSFMQSAGDKMAQLQGTLGGFAGGVGEAVGGAASGVGEAVGGAASAVGTGVDQQRQQLQQYINAAPTAEAQPATAAAPPGGGYDPSSLGRTPAVEPPAAAPVPTAEAAPAGPDFGAMRAQLQQHINAAPLGEAVESAGQGLEGLRGQLQQYIQAAPMSLQAANEPPLAAVGRGGDLRAYARQAAQRQGVDPDIFERQIQQESGFRPEARSPAGATGVAQIMPNYHPNVDPNDPYASLDYAAGLMKSNLGKYQGDYSKALAAYNAGAGNVEKYGGVPPFEETQRYVSTILGGQKPPQQGTGAADISQFGDPQLSNEEAYAACGPAAAVRFAQRFGRNPSLREAVDLASQVGWSAGQGMAGIGSEQALLNKMGIETNLIQGGQWDKFAREAQTGNPVTISTPGHYFYADGYNPDTGQFHVGKSGTDLRGGSEWMTREQIEGRMGAAQGALFANNPTVQASSTAEKTHGAFDLFGQAVDKAKSEAARAVEGLLKSSEEHQARGRAWMDEQLANVDQAVNSAAFREPAGGNKAISAFVTRGPSETVQRQMAGEEDVPFGPTPITFKGLPGRAAGVAGAAGEFLNEISPFTTAGRLYEGAAGEVRRDPQATQHLNEIFEAEARGDKAGALAAQQAFDRRKNEINSGLNWDLNSIYQRGIESPERENVEMLANLAGGVASTGAAPKGLASGAGRFLTSLALDPSGAPFNIAGELPGLARLGGRAAPQAGEAARMVESLPGYPSGTPEALVEDAMRASRDASPDGLAHVDLHQLAPMFERVGQGSKIIQTNPGGVPDMDALRTLRDANLHNKAFYYDQADDAVNLVGKENLGEWFSLNAINSPLTRVERQIEESINAMGLVREVAADARARGVDVEQAVADAIQDKARLSLAGTTAGNKRRDILESYLTGRSEVVGAPKTSSFAGNYDSAGRRVYDPRVTNDIWNWRIMNVSDDVKETVKPDGKIVRERPWEKAAANHDGAYRLTEAAFNELAREIGSDGHSVQSMMWSGLRAMEAKRPDLYKMWQNGQFIDAVKQAEQAGVFQLADAGEIAVAMQKPGIQKALARYGHLLQDPPPLQGLGMSREYMGGGAPKGVVPRPSSAPFREEQRAIAESRGQIIPGLNEATVRALGTDERGQIPWLETSHRIQKFGPDEYAIQLPAGNSMTQRWVASLLGDALGAPEMVVHNANYRAPDIGGFSIVQPPEVIDALRRELDADGIKYLGGTTGRSLQIPLEGPDAGQISAITSAAGRAGLAPADLTHYAGATNRVLSEEYARNLADLGPAFGPTTPERSDLLNRAVRDLRRLGTERFGGPDLAAEAESLGGATRGPVAGLLARGAAPLRSQLAQGALGGGVGAGYEAAQEEGATPQDVAKAALGGSVSGALRAALPGGAVRNLGRFAAIAERAEGASPFENPEVARLLEAAQKRGQDPVTRLGAEIARLQNMPAHLAEGAQPRIQAMQDALAELTRPAERASEAARPPAEAARPAAEAAAEVPYTAPTVPTDAAREWAGNLKLGKYLPEEVRDIIATVHDVNPEMYQAAKRGEIPIPDMKEMADNLGVSVDRLVKKWKPGDAENAETIFAIRQAVANEGKNVLQAQRYLRRNPSSTDGQLALVDALTRMQAMEEMAVGVTGEAGRSLRQFREPVEGRNKMMQQLMKMARSKKMGMDELAKELSGVDLENPAEAVKLATKLNPRNQWADRLWALYYFSLLSTPTTHMRNIFSNALTAVTTPAESLAAGAMDLPSRGIMKALGAKDTGTQRYLGEALADVVGMSTSLGTGAKRALKAYMEPASAEEIMAGSRAPEAFSGPLGAVIHAPGRALSSEDAFFKSINEGAAGHRMAYRQALQEGVRGPGDLSKRMAEILRDPDKKFLAEMQRQGVYRTFQQDGGIAQDLMWLRHKNPAMRFALPFVRTPWNMLKYSAERSPFGYAGIIKDLATKGGRESLRQRGAGDLADRLGRAGIGSLLTYGLYQYAAGGDNLTGRAPDNPTERDAFYREGKQPYSFKAGDKWLSYQPFQPYTPLLSAVANATDALKRDPERAQKDLPGLLGLTGLAFGQGLFDMPWTQGLADIFDVMGSGDDAETKWKNWSNRQAASFVPGALRAVARAQDTTVRDPDNLWESVQANLPFRQGEVPARQNVWGEARQRPVGGIESLISPTAIFNASQETSDPVEIGLRKLQKLGYDVEPGFVGNKVSVEGIPTEITDEQQRSYQRTSGQLSYALLQILMGSHQYEALPDERKAEIIDKIVSGVRTDVREMMTPEFLPQAAEALERQSRMRAGGQ